MSDTRSNDDLERRTTGGDGQARANGLFALPTEPIA